MLFLPNSTFSVVEVNFSKQHQDRIVLQQEQTPEAFKIQWEKSSSQNREKNKIQKAAIQPTQFYDIHGCVASVVSWDDDVVTKVQMIVTKHIQNNVPLKETQTKYMLTDDEVGAIVYYTLDISRLGCSKENNPFWTVNHILRNQQDPGKWQAFLDILLKGLSKLPDFSGTVFRAIDKNLAELSNDYKVGYPVFFYAFTSTSTKRGMLCVCFKAIHCRYNQGIYRKNRGNMEND